MPKHDEYSDADDELEIYRESLTPEQDLWFAVFRDAWRTVSGRKYKWEDRTEFEKQIKSDREWFNHSDIEPGSFRWVCEALGLDSEYIRSNLEDRGFLSGGVVISPIESNLYATPRGGLSDAFGRKRIVYIN